MNLELLKKLTKLANNNPNENEANLAARRVCKMLEEGKWALPNARPAPDSFDFIRDVQQEAYRYAAEHARRAKEEAAAKKATEAGEARRQENIRREAQERYEKGNNPYAKENWDFKAGTKQRIFYDGDYVGDFGSDWHTRPHDWDIHNKNYKPKEKKEKNSIECSECHNIVETTYMGHRGTYICGPCAWKRHNAERK